MKTLLLSAGHYPERSGASWKNYREHDQAVKWVREIAQYLVLKHRTNAVVIRTGKLPEKVKAVNHWADKHDCLAVELHFNSAGSVYVQGAETLFYPGSINGKAAAEKFHTGFMIQSKAHVKKDRGIKEGWYRLDRPGVVDYAGDVDGDETPAYWLRKTKCTALILEPCFMCQIPDIGDDWKEVAHAIADALHHVLDEY